MSNHYLCEWRQPELGCVWGPQPWPNAGLNANTHTVYYRDGSKYSSFYSACALTIIHHLCKTNSVKVGIRLVFTRKKDLCTYFRSMWKKLNFCMKQSEVRETPIISWLSRFQEFLPAKHVVNFLRKAWTAAG